MAADASPLILRLAEPADAAAINAIYNPYVLASTCTYQETPDTLADRERWLAARGERHPATVAVLDGAVVGWGSLSSFRERSAYRFSCEHSVYVDQSRHRRGVGAALLRDLVARARALRFHTMVAGIDAEQTTSLAFHARMGFIETGRMRQVGWKFDRWLDVVFMQLMLDGGEVGVGATP